MSTVSHLGYFPFCIEEVELWDGLTFVDYIDLTAPSQSSSSFVPVCGAGTHYPIAMSLQDACTFYWRVKRWRVQCDLSFETTYLDLEESGENQPLSYFSSVNSTGGTFQLTRDENNDPFIDPTEEQYYDEYFANEKETSRVCDVVAVPNGTILGFEVNPLATETWSNEYITYTVGQQPTDVSNASFNLLFSMLGNWFEDSRFLEPRIVKEKDTDNYYPYIFIKNEIVGANYGLCFFTNLKQENGRSYNEYDYFPIGEETITITCAEKTFELPIFVYGSTNDLPPPSETIVNYSLQASIEGFKYFPYDPNDGGGPIYDEDTGEQIR
jgi:hypothetical protein